MSFTIAIVGRPNVGKSTLFNRLVGRKLALVDDQPGVTRDRREGEARLGDLDFTVIDTAGLEEGAKGSLTARMQEQTETAIEQADALIFLIDARAGLTPLDRAFADFARRADKPVLLVANKSEGRPANRRDGILRAWPRRSRPDLRRARRGHGRSLRRAARDAAAGRGGEEEEDDSEDSRKRPIRVRSSAGPTPASRP